MSPQLGRQELVRHGRLPVCNHNGPHGACPCCQVYMCAECAREHACPVTPCWVYGASDDLIEVEGVIRAEFDIDAGPTLLAFSTGVVLEIDYTKSGIWRIRCLAGCNQVRILHAPDNCDDDYSDVAQLSEPPQWVVRAAELTERVPEGNRRDK